MFLNKVQNLLKDHCVQLVFFGSREVAQGSLSPGIIGHSRKGVKQDKDEFTEQSFEDARLHANSYRQTLSFTPTYSVTFLATGNFRHPPRAGFLCTYLTLRLI